MIKLFISDYDRLDILVNNAGIGSGSGYRKEESNDFEKYINKVFQVNYIGTFILTELLLPILKVSFEQGLLSQLSEKIYIYVYIITFII